MGCILQMSLSKRDIIWIMHFGICTYDVWIFSHVFPKVIIGITETLHETYVL